jgi:hypothetical protein
MSTSVMLSSNLFPFNENGRSWMEGRMGTTAWMAWTIVDDVDNMDGMYMTRSLDGVSRIEMALLQAGVWSLYLLGGMVNAIRVF